MIWRVEVVSLNCEKFSILKSNINIPLPVCINAYIINTFSLTFPNIFKRLEFFIKKYFFSKFWKRFFGEKCYLILNIKENN